MAIGISFSYKSRKFSIKLHLYLVLHFIKLIRFVAFCKIMDYIFSKYFNINITFIYYTLICTFT